MDYVIWIILAVILFVLVIIIKANKNKNKNYDNVPQIDDQLRQQDIESYQLHSQINIEPILSTHAKERMEQRLGIDQFNQEEMMRRAFNYGKTSNKSIGDLKAKLESTEEKYEEPTVAKFYNGAIFIFSEEDNVLKTVYKYDPNRYLN